MIFVFFVINYFIAFVFIAKSTFKNSKFMFTYFSLISRFYFSFYRYVLEPDLNFNADGSASPGPLARFENLPQKSLLTLNMHPPESWLVESVKSLYDLDNIMLEEVSWLAAFLFFSTWKVKR